MSDIDGLKIFKLYDHPKIRVQIEVMKTEVLNHQTLVDFIKSFEERKENKGKDTFDLSDCSPNSCPTESLFMIFNVTYNDDQKKSHTDYLE